MKKHIDNEHGAMVSKYKNHHTKEVEFTSPGREKSKKRKRVAPNILEANDLTRILIQHKYNSLKT